MQVFKFGGASIKSAPAIKNILEIVKQYDNNLVIIVSAMGKTTNALESICRAAWHHKDFKTELSSLQTYHQEVMSSLVPESQNHFKKTWSLFQSLDADLVNTNKFPSQNAFYDHIVAFGELISSSIIHAYLKINNFDAQWINAKDYVITSHNHKEANVNWPVTRDIVNGLIPILNDHIIITQGFIGGTPEGKYTTLGREGSDFSAAIFGACLGVDSVTIWKDVPGILNADPKIIKAVMKFKSLNYYEAAEMTYYGASVIHPKTIKPLANAKIPLYVKSFENPLDEGTVINDLPTKDQFPTIIFKPNQHLINFKVKDFTFINESNLSIIFHLLDNLNIKINMMQNSAISLSICIDEQVERNAKLINNLKNDFEISHQRKLSLMTVKNYIEQDIEGILSNKEVLLEQKTKTTFQVVIRDITKQH